MFASNEMNKSDFINIESILNANKVSTLMFQITFVKMSKYGWNCVSKMKHANPDLYLLYIYYRICGHSKLYYISND